MTIKGITHKDKRPHIPSREEAGTEADKAGEKTEARLPLNPVSHRGQDPELYWLNKYGPDNTDSELKIDIRSLYRHEHIAPELLIQRLYKLKERTPESRQNELFVNEVFGNALNVDELDKPASYYKRLDGWMNRLIQGDSLLVMTSLLEREGLAGKVQMIYLDPPYGIKYGSNWQMRLNDRNVKDGDDASLTGEGEVIKAFRDTWELGIHSYLSYLRERLLVAKQLLTESGSCFVQISDENVHLVRCLMDEVFGSASFQAELLVKKKGSQKGEFIDAVNDYVIWYGKQPKNDPEVKVKFRPLFEKRELDSETLTEFSQFELTDGRVLSSLKGPAPDGGNFDYRLSPKRLFVDYPGARLFRAWPITNGGDRPNQMDSIAIGAKTISPPKGRCWSFRSRTDDGSTPPMMRLGELGRLLSAGKSLDGKRYLDDFQYKTISNWWDGLGGASSPVYVVQTNDEIIKRCMLMTTQPGDLVLDPTCGSGTTAYVAEQWGRRWITIDTSRIALNIAKTRLSTATFPWYVLLDEKRTAGDPACADIRNGFVYKKVPHVTLKSLANDEPAEEETLYDQPEKDNKRLRVAGPFTVETLQAFEPLNPELLDQAAPQAESLERFEQRVFEHLKSAGIKNGDRNEQAVFTRVQRLSSAYLHAEGYYDSAAGERKAYLHIGPQFGSIAKQSVNEAVKECRRRGDADWLVLLGFAFESDLANQIIGRAETTKLGSFEVSKVRMHDDLMQEGLLKKDKKAASFMTIGEPDIALVDADGGMKAVEVRGLDIYDPITDTVRPRAVADVSYWMVDDDYDGANFVVRQIFFCGGDKDEFDKWKRGLSDLAKQSVKRNAERTLKVEIDDEAFERVYGFRSHPFAAAKGQRVAVRVISQFGEESTKVLAIS